MKNTIFILSLCLLFMGCGGSAKNDVVVYVSLDEMYSRLILDQFERESGINVRAVYDTEAAKTTGLVTRLTAEQARPRADVFWNNEPIQMIMLAEKNVLAPYESPAASAIPEQFKDSRNRWTGLAARARVIIYNTNLVSAPPKKIEDLLKPEWRGKACIANPLFGTTASHAAALFALWGEQRAQEFLVALKANDIAVVSGNSVVRDMVGRGEYAWGLTDTDDAHGGQIDGLPVKWHFPDQADGIGTLLLPNAVGLINGAPNGSNGQLLIDYLLSPKVEEQLANSRSLQIPLGTSAKAPAQVPAISDIKTMAVSYEQIAQEFEKTAQWLRDEFVQ